MRWIIALILSPSLCFGFTYRLDSSTYTYNSAIGTFVDNGTTYGWIVGMNYTVAITSGPYTVKWSSSVNRYNNPLKTFPTKAQLKTAIKADAISKNARFFVKQAFIEKACKNEATYHAAEQFDGMYQNFFSENLR